jgi:hypothetical protein
MNDENLLGDYVHWWDTLSQADQVWESQQCVLMMLHAEDMSRPCTLMVDGEQHPAPNPDYDEIPF